MSGRVLFVGGLRKDGNGPDWLQAIERQGLTVVPFDTKSYAARGSRLEQALARRTGLGRHIARLNHDLQALAGRERFDFVFVTKGVHVQAATVRRLAAYAAHGAVLHLTVDSMFADNRSRHFFNAIPRYHTLFTDKRFEMQAYRDAGARRVILFDQPYGLRFDAHDAINAAREGLPDSDVCFIGHCQPHYVAVLKAVSDMGVDLRIWGPGWPALARAEAWARPHVMGDGLWGAAYPAAMSRARIGIGLLSKRIPEEATTRSVEVPAAGTFLLAERSARHSEMFAEGREAEFFGDLGEMRDKIARYLADDGARQRVAAAGAVRARACYNMTDTVARLLAGAGQLPAAKGAAHA
jgi:hypothetical protein